MTSAFDSITEFILVGKAAKAEERAIAREELEKMSKAMVEEKGLLNHAQAALALGVSVKRVWELVRLEKLRRFDFAGRTYVSMTEVLKRCDEEIAAGKRLARSLPKRFIVGTKMIMANDAAQTKLGGIWGPYEKARLKERRRKLDEQEEKRKKEAREFLKSVVDPRRVRKPKIKK